MSGKNGVRQLVVLGAGPGGYAAAFHAADLGMEVTLVDREPNPGGVCLYRGCIPTKALLHAAKLITDAREAKQLGLKFGEPKIDLDQLRKWKNSVIDKLTQGLGHLGKKRKIEYVQGEAQFKDGNNIEVKKKRNDTEVLSFEHAILAAGGVPARIPGIPYESPGVLDSTSALELKKIPGSMLVIGGGYIGLELGSIYASFGTKVSVVEMTPGLMPGSDRELISVLSKRLEKLFDLIMLETRVARIKERNGLKVAFEGKDLERSEAVFEQVLVAVGRKPNSSGLGLENTNIQIDEKGFVRTDKTLRTDDESIYAVGDVTSPPQLAHKATHEGMIAAKAIAGLNVVFEPRVIPFIEYTDPEVAECGLSEEKAREQQRNIKVTKFPWSASGRAATLGRNDGLTKLIIDTDSGRLLGAGIVGPGAGELISESALAVEMAAVAEDIAMTIHPHPTLSETVMEAAESFLGKSIHLGK